MKVELLGIDAPSWASFVADTRHDFYHLPPYVALCASQEGGEASALLVSERGRAMLLPLIIRPIPQGGIDATSPYGYPGPLVSGSDDPSFIRRALTAGIGLLESLGITSLFVRTHPLLSPAPPRGVGIVVRGGDTVGIDLTLPLDELWHQTRADHRSHINRAIKSGREALFDERWVYFEEFKRLYNTTMERVSADSYYLFDGEYFDRLRSALGQRLRLGVVKSDGAVAAAALFVETCGIVQYHLAGTNPDFAREAPTKLMLHFVRAWAKERGDLTFHLGGGLGAAHDTLLRFKAGFSPLRHRFYTLRVIINKAEYARLVRSRPRSVAPERSLSFFPAYRDPVSKLPSAS